MHWSRETRVKVDYKHHDSVKQFSIQRCNLELCPSNEASQACFGPLPSLTLLAFDALIKYTARKLAAQGRDDCDDEIVQHLQHPVVVDLIKRNDPIGRSCKAIAAFRVAECGDGYLSSTFLLAHLLYHRIRHAHFLLAFRSASDCISSCTNRKQDVARDLALFGYNDMIREWERIEEGNEHSLVTAKLCCPAVCSHLFGILTNPERQRSFVSFLYDTSLVTHFIMDWIDNPRSVPLWTDSPLVGQKRCRD